MLEKLKAIEDKYEELNGKIQSPEVYSDPVRVCPPCQGDKGNCPGGGGFPPL